MENLKERLYEAGYDDTYVIEGLDDAFIGVTENRNAVYDEDLIVGDIPNIDENIEKKPYFIKRIKDSSELSEDTIVIGTAGKEAQSLSNAIIGETQNGCAAYDYDTLIECFMEHNEWSYEDAVEWCDYNTFRSLPYYYDKAPIIIMNIDYMID